MSSFWFAVGGDSSARGQLHLHRMSFAYDQRSVFSDLSFTVSTGDRLGIVGPNGSGKSTLLRIMHGDLRPGAGTVARVPSDLTVGLLTQHLDDSDGETVLGLARRRTGIAAAVEEFESATNAITISDAYRDGVVADRFDRALTRLAALRPDEFDHRLQQVLESVGLAGMGLDQRCDRLSGGQRTRLNLAVVLLAGHDVLLLDEPTNNLDQDGLELLQTAVQQRAGATVIISHDREFLSVTTNAIAELDPHTQTLTRYNGGFDSWQHERHVARSHHEAAYADYLQKRTALTGRARQQRQWASKGANRARRSGEPDKVVRNYAIETSENLAAKAKTTERAIERLEVVDKPWEPWQLRLRFPVGERSAERVAELAGVTVHRGGFVFGPPGHEVSVRVDWGDRVLVTGPNGAGKSTLLATLLGAIQPHEGTAHLARNARVGWVRQGTTLLDGPDPVLHQFATYTGIPVADARSQLAKFGLLAEHLERPTNYLSPGEQTRVTLAALAAGDRNVLVFDEPTNHLDLEAIEELEVALNRYGGTLLVVTHDRRLQDALAVTRHFAVDHGHVAEINPS